MNRLAGLFAAAVLASCSNDRIVPRSCPEQVTETTDETVTKTTTTTTPQSEFNIEQVSVLQATMVLKNGADAVILDHDASRVPAGSAWRVGKVDVLVMVPAADFNGYPGSVGLSSVGLTVQVWDDRTPTNAQHPAYVLHQVLDVSKLQWDTVSLSNGLFNEAWKKAWWTFDFADAAAPLIPASGMTAQQFLVGVKWDGSGEPSLGYSNFNRPCDRNWTNDPGQGGNWKLNSSYGSASSCNWPMLRVGTEVITQVTTTETHPVTTTRTVMVERDECDPNAVDVLLDAGTTVAEDAGQP